MVSPSISEAKRAGRRRTQLRVALGVALTPIVLFVVLFGWVGVTGRHHDVPPEIYATGSPRAVAEALRGTPPQAETGEEAKLLESDPFRLDPDVVYEIAPDDEADPLLQEAADRWVQELNRLNPGAILYHEVDAVANLYLFPGAWLYEFNDRVIARSTEKFGRMWQQYLLDAFGDWAAPELGPDEGYSPGLLFFDCKGEVSRMMAGHIRVLRTPDICE